MYLSDETFSLFYSYFTILIHILRCAGTGAISGVLLFVKPMISWTDVYSVHNVVHFIRTMFNI